MHVHCLQVKVFAFHALYAINMQKSAEWRVLLAAQAIQCCVPATLDIMAMVCIAQHAKFVMSMQEARVHALDWAVQIQWFAPVTLVITGMVFLVNHAANVT